MTNSPTGPKASSASPILLSNLYFNAVSYISSISR